MNDATVAVTSLIIFVSALLIVLPVPRPPPSRRTEGKVFQSGHVELPRPPERMSEQDWKEFRAVVFGLIIAFVSGIMALDAMGFLEPRP